MKIKKISKKKNNLYEITFDNNEKISLYDDIILKYNLLITKEINDLEKIIHDNTYLQSYYIALKYINSKLRTEKEIKKKLINYPSEVVNYTLNRLKKEGYLNESLYIKAYINDEINLKLTGPAKIIFNLKKLGFKEADILNYLNSFSHDIWSEKITKYIKKKIESNHNLSSLMLQKKIMQDLINKGFYKEDIIFILEEFIINDDENIYQKEYNKLKNKLSKKYNGEELEYQIKNHLYKKGFKV